VLGLMGAPFGRVARVIATSLPSAPAVGAPDGATGPMRIDLSIARVLLVLSLALVAIYGSDVARHVPRYGPIDEIFHVAYVQRIADSGHPPVVGQGLIIGLGQKPPTVRDVVIAGLDHPFDPKLHRHVTPVFPDGTTFPQNEAIQPPLYYYAMTPIAVLVPWSHRVLVMRLAGTFFVMLALILLYRAVRVVSPHRPLAAGLSAAILGTMTGLTSLLSQVQNDALLLPLSAAMFWLLARDVRSRRAGLWLPLVAGASVITQLLAAPAAIVAVLAALWFDERVRELSWRSRAGLSRIVSRLALLALPVAPWVAFNLYEYRWFWPIANAAAGAPSARNFGLIRHSLELLHTAAFGVFGSLWLQIWPLRAGVVTTDLRAPAVIAAAGFLALIVSFANGEILRERRRLAFWAGVALVSFLGAFIVLLANATSVGGQPDFVARYFCAFAAAYAALVGTAVASIGNGRPWLVRGSACALALVLAWQMLDTAYPSIVG
jgi:Dolichyl-phosphate-mannose-protein mannosyltransferase